MRSRPIRRQSRVGADGRRAGRAAAACLLRALAARPAAGPHGRARAVHDAAARAAGRHGAAAGARSVTAAIDAVLRPERRAAPARPRRDPSHVAHAGHSVARAALPLPIALPKLLLLLCVVPVLDKAEPSNKVHGCFRAFCGASARR